MIIYLAIATISLCVGAVVGFFVGAAYASRRILAEEDRCPVLKVFHNSQTGTLPASSRCELPGGHYGPHKHTVESNQGFRNAGMVLWWEDAPDRKTS